MKCVQRCCFNSNRFELVNNWPIRAEVKPIDKLKRELKIRVITEKGVNYFLKCNFLHKKNKIINAEKICLFLRSIPRFTVLSFERCLFHFLQETNFLSE